MDANHNYILRMLPASDYERLYAHLERVSLPLGEDVWRTKIGVDYVCFPVDAIVSLLGVMEDGESTELALIGSEGIVGLSLLLGAGRSTVPTRKVVQSAGIGYRLAGPVFKDEFESGGALQQLVLHYTQALMSQIGQTAACNCHHTVDQQLCRWLLLSYDRLIGDELVMTQALIADMLGVRRERVTQAAGNLQKAGLIRYRRGHIKILDRQGLEARSCECYHVISREYRNLLP